MEQEQNKGEKEKPVSVSTVKKTLNAAITAEDERNMFAGNSIAFGNVLSADFANPAAVTDSTRPSVVVYPAELADAVKPAATEAAIAPASIGIEPTASGSTSFIEAVEMETFVSSTTTAGHENVNFQSRVPLTQQEFMENQAADIDLKTNFTPFYF